MKNLYKLYGTDKKSEVEGIRLFVDGYDENTDPYFIIARAGGHNTEYQRVLSEKYNSIGNSRKIANLTPEDDRKLLMEVYADAVVKGWRNIADEKGTVLQFNKKNFISLMTDLPDLWDAIRSFATDASKFQAEKEEEAVKK